MSKAKDSTNSLSTKQLAQDLGIADALIKKLIKDFDLKTEKVNNRAHLDNETVETIRTITKLKANGKKTKEIKEMFLAAQQARSVEQKTPASPEPELVTAPLKAEEQPAQIETRKDPKLAEEQPRNRDENRRDRNRNRNKNYRSSEQRTFDKTENSQAQEGDLDISDFIRDEVEDKHDDSLLQEALSMDEVDDLEDSSEQDISLEAESSPDKPEHKRRRRFNFRYVQRQIAHDTRKVSYLKNKLERSTLSTFEREATRDALDRRAKLLNGWIHLLRWIKAN